MSEKKPIGLDRETVLYFPVLTPTGKVALCPSLQDRWRITTNAWLHHFLAFRHVLGKTLGWKKANRILERSWADMAGEPGSLLRGYQRAFGIKGEGAQLLSRLAQFQSQAEGHDVEMVADEPQRAGWRSVCIWWYEWSHRWQDSALKHFENHLCFPGCRNIWAKETRALDPSLRVRQTLWMGKGDSCCEFIIEKKNSAKDEHFIFDSPSKGGRKK